MNAPTTRPCDGPVHNHPLPDGLRPAADEATRRRREGWQITKCDRPKCPRWGWTHPDDADPTGGR